MNIQKIFSFVCAFFFSFTASCSALLVQETHEPSVRKVSVLPPPGSNILIVGAVPTEEEWKNHWLKWSLDYNLTFLDESTSYLSSDFLPDHSTHIDGIQVFRTPVNTTNFLCSSKFWNCDFNGETFKKVVAQIKPEDKFDLIINDYCVSYFIKNPTIVEFLNLLKPNGKCVFGPVCCQFGRGAKFVIDFTKKSLIGEDNRISFDKKGAFYVSNEEMFQYHLNRLANHEDYLSSIVVQFLTKKDDKSRTDYLHSFSYDMMTTPDQIGSEITQVKEKAKKENCDFIDQLDEDLEKIKNAVIQSASNIRPDKAREYLSAELKRSVSLEPIPFECIKHEILDNFLSPSSGFKEIAGSGNWVILSLK